MAQDPDPLAATHGVLIDTTPALAPDSSLPLHGELVTLQGLTKDHIPSLWQHLDLLARPELVDYIAGLSPNNAEELWLALENLRIERGFTIYAVLADPERLNPGSNTETGGKNEVVGVIAYLNISTLNRELEVVRITAPLCCVSGIADDLQGLVLFSKLLQRTVAATEATYLMIQNAFQPPSGPSYRRVCWKCNSLNKPSRRAAERLGFVYEGTFRKHMISRGRNRDSDWLSIVDDEWLIVKQALKKWMANENFDGDGRQRRGLDEIRAEVAPTSDS